MRFVVKQKIRIRQPGTEYILVCFLSFTCGSFVLKNGINLCHNSRVLLSEKNILICFTTNFFSGIVSILGSNSECEVIIYSISISYLSNSPAIPANENLAFLIQVFSGSNE